MTFQPASVSHNTNGALRSSVIRLDGIQRNPTLHSGTSRVPGPPAGGDGSPSAGTGAKQKALRLTSNIG